MRIQYFTFFLLFGLTICFANEASIQTLIQNAGNADRDETRLEILQELRDHPQADDSLKKDADHLIEEIKRWIDGADLDYFGRKVRRDLDWDFHIDSDSPLYPITRFYLARMLVWYALESGNVWGYADRREEFLGKARRLFKEAYEAYPNNKIIGMYLGDPIAAPKEYKPHPKAGPIHNAQREGLERLADIVEWWIDNRLRENGEYGGGWGDDCEMWRVWVPVLIAFDDPKITKAQAFFSKALLNQPHMRKGYTTRMSDVEHTAEDSADAITPMMLINPDDPEWQKRVFQLADFMENLWCGVNQRGFYQFKSTYFTAEKVDLREDRTCDTCYHPRAMQPALLYWQRTGDERLQKLFSRWMDTWVDAAARAERGKPAGVVPSAIHWPEGYIGGVGMNWWNPENHGEPRLYTWPSALSLMTHTLLLTYHMTGDEKYFEPLKSMAEIRMQYFENPPQNDPEPGTLDWCAQRINLNSELSKYRFLTSDHTYDELIAKENDPYLHYKLSKRHEPLVEVLERTAKALSLNFEGYTSEVRYTDRVVRFPKLFRDDVNLPGKKTDIPKPNLDILYTTSTGDPGDFGYFPLNRVRWLTPPRNISAIVSDAHNDYLSAQLFHFGEEPRPMQAELYGLEKGRYSMYLIDAGQNEQQKLVERNVTVTSLRTRISFTLPPQSPCFLGIHRANVREE